MRAWEMVLFAVAGCFSLGWVATRSPSGPADACRAYLDPSTGAMIVSAVIGIAATIALGVKTFWYKLVAPFRRKKSPERTAK